MSALTHAKAAPLWALCFGLMANSAAVAGPNQPTPIKTSCSVGTAVPASSLGGDVNRAAIQARLDAAKAGAMVRLGSGVFTLSGALRLPTGVTLCSASGAILKWAGPAAAEGAAYAIDGGTSSNIRVANITFDGAGIVLSGGSNAIIEANVFRNVKPVGLTSTQNVYGWTALKLVDTASIKVRQNVFVDLAAGGIAAWRLTGSPTNLSEVTGNWFARMNQPISMDNAQYVTIDRNEGYEIERMAVELIGAQMADSAVLVNPGIVVSNNRFSNWKGFNTKDCLGNGDCLKRYEIAGISVVSSTGAKIIGNVLDCGLNCVQPRASAGIEFSSFGKGLMQLNTVRGFEQGIWTAWGQDMVIEQNAVFSARVGISSTQKGYIDKLTIRANQIETAVSRPNVHGDWGVGIAPQWGHVGEVLITDNTVAYKTSPTSDLSGGEYVGIFVATTKAGGKPGEISNNRVLVEGAPAAGFEVFGIRLAGAGGSLRGTVLNNNWIAAVGGSTAKQGTALDGGWQDNGTLGVTLSNNVFQNLAHVNRYYANHRTNGAYMATANWAINMDAAAAPIPDAAAPVLAQAKLVTLPTISVTASPTTPVLGTAPATFRFVSSIGTSPTEFKTARWHYGDGRIAGEINSITGTYAPGAARVVRALARDVNGALITATRTIGQN